MPRPPVAPPSGAELPRPPAGDLLSGQTLDGRLRVLRPIGHGGMGTVYVAEHIGLGKQVAVKVLNAQYAGQPEVVARLHAEARNAAAIASEHIVDIFDIGLAESGQPYVVMELLHGESLAERLRRCTALSELDTLHIGRQLATALSAAHRSGIVHRDIKPENIFLCHREGRDFVKLLDFGISKAVGPLNDGELESWAAEEAAGGAPHSPPKDGRGSSPVVVDRSAISGDFLHRLTRTGAIMGTPLYMSPEQARGDRLDSRCDIYSLGVVLYECLTGSVPFLAPSYFGVIAKILTETPEPPSLRIPDRALTPALERVVLFAMASDRSERYQTMDELLADLDRYQRGEPVRAGLDGSQRDARGRRRADGASGRPGNLRAASGEGAGPRGAVPQLLPLLGVTVAVLLLGGLLVFWRGPHELTAAHRASPRSAPPAATPQSPAERLVPGPAAPAPATTALPPPPAAPTTGLLLSDKAPPAGSAAPATAATSRPGRAAPVSKSVQQAHTAPGQAPAPQPLPPAFTDEQAPNPFVSPAPN